jgi:hypothetical protein
MSVNTGSKKDNIMDIDLLDLLISSAAGAVLPVCLIASLSWMKKRLRR